MMEKEDIISTWDKNQIITNLDEAFVAKSETKLLEILKNNSFLFYELFSRKYGIQPIFHEVNFGANLRCDFLWLNDNSSGPEWVLVEIEKPGLELFTKKGDPTYSLNHAIEQLKAWRRYFTDNNGEKRNIFGAVSRFRFILVAGNHQDWERKDASKWRIDNNNNSGIEIVSMDVFKRAIDIFTEHPEEFWSFAENPITLGPSQLKEYHESNNYIDHWRKILN